MTIKSYSITGPLFKLALEKSTKLERFVTARNRNGSTWVYSDDVGKKITMAQLNKLIASGTFGWCGYSEQWRVGGTIGWIVGIVDGGSDYVVLTAPSPDELSEMRKIALADAAIAGGSKRAIPKTLVKSLVGAIRSGDAGTVKKLAPMGAKGTYKEKENEYSTDYTNIGPLFVAAELESPSMLEILLPHVDVNAEDDLGNSALHIAVRDERIANVKALLKAGVDARKPNANEWAPLHLAAKLGERGILDLLLPLSDANAKGYKGRNALMEAIENRRLENIKALIPFSDLDVRDDDGLTALMIAFDPSKIDKSSSWSRNDHNASVADGARVIADACKDIEATDKDGNTALMRLVAGVKSFGGKPVTSIELLEILIDKGADMNRLYANGDSMLIAAARREHTRACHQLSQTTAAAKWMAPRKLSAVLS